MIDALRKIVGLSPRYNPNAVAAHRKTIKVYDVFIFFNELELLDIRLHILAPYVDRFVIVESTTTFAGAKKPLYYSENRHLFKDFEDKIIHYVVEDMPVNEDELRSRLQIPELSKLDREIITNALTSDNVPSGQPHWLREFYQKECMKKPLVGLQDNDICFISDVDEIWNPQAKIDFRSGKIMKLKQLMYAYFLNNRSSENWAGTYATKYLNMKHASLNHLDTPSKTKYTYIQDGGWHFTNLGGAERIKTKLESYGHQEFNNDDIKSQVEERITKNQDFIGRGFKFWIDESNLPQYILDHRDLYQRLLK